MSQREELNQIRERVDSGSYGRLYGAKETADDYLKITYAELRDNAPIDLVTLQIGRAHV